MHIPVALELENLFKLNFFSNLDYYFAKSMERAFKEKNKLVLATCALVSRSLREGHICIDIPKLSDQVIPWSEAINEIIKYPNKDLWLDALIQSSLIENTKPAPLVIDSCHRLYFSKYYNFQQRLISNIFARLSIPCVVSAKGIIDSKVHEYFHSTKPQELLQKEAIVHAVTSNFTLISGGPGTGKTFVTTIIKNILREYFKKKSSEQPKILCLAPTGKAAAKLDQGQTIHSALKPIRGSTGFYYNRKNKISADAVIIDEASMIDLPLLTRLLEAIPSKAKIILLGDHHQLSSVQAGAVFSDLCKVKNMSSHIFVLEHNFRSKGQSGIENLSKYINNNTPEKVENLLSSNQYSDVLFEDIDKSKSIDKIIQNHIIDGYQPFMLSQDEEKAMGELDTFKILCAHNSGEYGTLQINHLSEKILRSQFKFDIHKRLKKRIIMINTNDYQKKLFNGDTGVVFENQEEGKVYFKDRENRIKTYRYSDLPRHETAFGITIHKSQGAEFDTILLIIPDKLSPVMTRQLLYTAVTRARKKVIIVGQLKIIKSAIRSNVQRNSGITQYLEKEIGNLNY